MEAVGEADRSIMRVGGWGGLAAGVFIFVGLLAALLAAGLPETLREELENFSNRSIGVILETDLSLAALLLGTTLLAGLYVSLKHVNRGFARLGLGAGVFGFALGIVALTGFLIAQMAFSELYNDPLLDRSMVLVTYTAVDTLLTALSGAAFLFIGFAFAAFGLAMRGSPDFQRGLVWFTTVLGVVIILFALLQGGVLAIAIFGALFLVLGWKLTNLSKAS